MNRRVRFVPYKPKTILNKRKRADHWFWTRYSAYPYIGCQHGCEFCYCREQKYSPYDDPDDFAFVIKVKENAPDLLRRALSRAPVDLISTGDYQPAERKFGISRQMLEVCRDLGFPVFVLERSPLVLRDIELLQEINNHAPSVVAFSVISTPDSPDYARVRQMEHLAPAPEKRFAAMQRFARAEVLTGTCFMPILPGLCDGDANLESVIRWIADHGGRFVLAGSLTLADQQKNYFFEVLRERFHDLLSLYRSLYASDSYAPRAYPWRRIALRIRELCEKYGLSDRLLRPIIPGDKRALNKRIVERLANQVYELDIHQAPDHRIWAYRKAAWDHLFKDSNITIVLAGSHIGMMVDLMGHQAPLYGRFTAQLPVDPLPFAALRDFLPHFTAAERVAVLAVIGGVPAYLERFDDRRSLTENLRNLFMQRTSIFQTEPFF